MTLSRIEVKALVSSCKSCDLHSGCLGPIPFSGPSPTNLAVVGEAPGATEDQQRTPFIGPSGKLLRATLEKAEINTNDIAFLNVVSCFPRRTPRYSEVLACRANLWTQLQLIRPKYILLVGGVAVSSWWKDLTITEIRGNFWQAPWDTDIANEASEGDGWSWGYATWHPAAILRNEALRSQFEQDINWFGQVVTGKAVMDVMGRCVKCKSEEVQYYANGVVWCWACWPKNRAQYGAGRVVGIDVHSQQRLV